jgi:hypothetical protein
VNSLGWFVLILVLVLVLGFLNTDYDYDYEYEYEYECEYESQHPTYHFPGKTVEETTDHDEPLHLIPSRSA